MNAEDKKYEDISYMTGVINTMARDIDLDACFTSHCKERQMERNITNSDILYVLKRGRVEKFIEKSKTKMKNRKFYKYKMTGDYAGDEKSKREIGLIILVEVDRLRNPAIKIQKLITTMWEDI